MDVRKIDRPEREEENQHHFRLTVGRITQESKKLEENTYCIRKEINNYIRLNQKKRHEWRKTIRVVASCFPKHSLTVEMAVLSSDQRSSSPQLVHSWPVVCGYFCPVPSKSLRSRMPNSSNSCRCLSGVKEFTMVKKLFH